MDSERFCQTCGEEIEVSFNSFATESCLRYTAHCACTAKKEEKKGFFGTIGDLLRSK